MSGAGFPGWFRSRQKGRGECVIRIIMPVETEQPPPEGSPKRWILAMIATTLMIGWLAFTVWPKPPPPSDPRARAEQEHGIRLPPSAVHIQCRGDAWPWKPDRGASTMFEMLPGDLVSFVSGLPVRSHTAPAKPGPGDPLINGWNVWPVGAATFVPGNPQYGGFQSTWTGGAEPVQMLSCASPVGDMLHVEIWKLEEGALLVKMFTGWN